MTNEKQLTEWIKEAVSGKLAFHLVEWLAPIIAEYLVVKMEGEQL